MNDFTMVGTHDQNEGYGHATVATIKAMRRLGARFDIIPIEHDDLMWPAERTIEVSGLAVMWSVPEYWGFIKADELWGIFVWETTKLPGYRVEMINRLATRLFTFSEWAKGMFEDSGVTIPAHVMPHGVDQREYYYLERDHRDQPYTFLILGELADRKGWDLAYTAFLAEFEDNPDARLIMKTRGRCPLAECTDFNVEVIAEEYSVPQVRELYRQTDCFLFPSRGEGYGLPPREAAATGLPVVCTNWSGLTDGIEDYAYPLRIEGLVKAAYGYQSYEECGRWAVPDFEHLKELMRWCFEHREAAAHKGRRSAEWVRENCRWELGAQRLIDAVRLDGNS